MWAQMFNGLGLLFTIPALVGTAFFLLRMIMMMVGGTDHGDLQADSVVEVDLDGADAGDSTHAFNVLSFQSMSAFLMGFGWAGLVGFLSLGWEPLPSAALGAGGGVAMVWVLAWLMKSMYALATSGNISIDEAVGREGSVYATVPQKGTGRGQVKVVVRQTSRIYNAVTEGDAIPTGSRIRVHKANDDNTLTVVAV